MGVNMEIKEKIQKVLKEFDGDENMETYQALDKVRKIVDEKKKKTYTIYSEEDFAGGFKIEANDLEEAEREVIKLIDIKLL